MFSVNSFLVVLSLYMIIILYLSVVMDIKSKIMPVLIPIALTLVIALYLSVDEIKSLPIDGYPDKEFELVDYSTDGETVYLWAVEEDSEFPKTWVFPYTDEDVRKLQESKEKSEEGVSQLMKKKTGSHAGSGSLEIIGSPKSKVGVTSTRKDYE